jgi:hypothetical protein
MIPGASSGFSIPSQGRRVSGASDVAGSQRVSERSETGQATKPTPFDDRLTQHANATATKSPVGGPTPGICRRDSGPQDAT